MPGLDGKGPNGQGSMTGRGLGRCADADAATKGETVGTGRGIFGGRGRGRGAGFGRGNRFFSENLTKDNDAKK